MSGDIGRVRICSPTTVWAGRSTVLRVMRGLLPNWSNDRRVFRPRPPDLFRIAARVGVDHAPLAPALCPDIAEPQAHLEGLPRVDSAQCRHAAHDGAILPRELDG